MGSKLGRGQACAQAAPRSWVVMSRAQHWVPGNGEVRWSALLSMHQAPRALSSIWGPIQKWCCQTGGAQGRPARSLPCKEVLAALQRVTVFELLFFSFIFVLACLLFFWKSMSTLPRKQTMFDLHCFCELASSCSVRSDQAPNMSFLVVALALKTKPKREGNSRSINQSYTHTWKDSGEMRKWHALIAFQFLWAEVCLETLTPSLRLNNLPLCTTKNIHVRALHKPPQSTHNTPRSHLGGCVSNEHHLCLN